MFQRKEHWSKLALNECGGHFFGVLLANHSDLPCFEQQTVETLTQKRMGDFPRGQLPYYFLKGKGNLHMNEVFPVGHFALSFLKTQEEAKSASL